jgi:hypothetical protein
MKIRNRPFPPPEEKIVMEKRKKRENVLDVAVSPPPCALG